MVSQGPPVSVQRRTAVFRLFERNFTDPPWLPLGVENRDIGRCAGGEAPARQVESRAGSRERRETSVPSGKSPDRPDDPWHGDGRLQTDDAERGAVELAFLLGERVGRWSVAMQSIVPSARARRAPRCRAWSERCASWLFAS